eukprot:gene8567-9270_t
MTTKERPFSVESVIDLAQVFPVKLYDLLSNPRYEEILAWRPSGVAFEILQPKRLVREVLPTIFNQKKWTSFQRQLNIYGFKKVRRGSDMNSYFHPYFRKDHIELLDNVHRIPIKGASSFFNDFPAPVSPPTLPPEPTLPPKEMEVSIKKPVLKRIVTISPTPETLAIPKDSLPPPLTLPTSDFPSNFGSLPPPENKNIRKPSSNLISKYASMVTQASLPAPFHYTFIPMPVAVHPFYIPHSLSWNQYEITPPFPALAHVDHYSSSVNPSTVENSINSANSSSSILEHKIEEEDDDEWSRILTELQEF